MSDDDKTKKTVADYLARIDSGQPIMSLLVEPPVKINVEDGCVHIDAPCLGAGGTDKAAVVRISLTAAVAKGLRDFLNTLSFTDNQGTSQVRPH